MGFSGSNIVDILAKFASHNVVLNIFDIDVVVGQFCVGRRRAIVLLKGHRVVSEDLVPPANVLVRVEVGLRSHHRTITSEDYVGDQPGEPETGRDCDPSPQGTLVNVFHFLVLGFREGNEC